LSLELPQLVTAKDGRVKLHMTVQSALWASFDQIQVFVNNAPLPKTDDDDGPGRTYPHSNCTPSEITLPDVPRYAVSADYTFNRDTDFELRTIIDYPEIQGAGHLEAEVTLDLNLERDSWIVAIVRGTDGISAPLFPVIPGGLDQNGNDTVADLTDGNVGEGGILALAFNNPLFVDTDGNGRFDPPGVQLRTSSASFRSGSPQPRRAAPRISGSDRKMLERSLRSARLLDNGGTRR
jgi:hypothetical protein